MKKGFLRTSIFAAACLLMILQGAAPAVQETTPSAKHPIDKWLSDCLEKNSSTRGMLDCFAEGYTRWDAELNRLYKELMSKLGPEEQAALREAQKAWLKQRDETFKLLSLIYAKKDGTMYLTMQAADRVDIVQKRAQDLASYLDLLNME